MKKFTLLLWSVIAVAALQAQIIHVPADYSTIQQGINAATPGDTVLVAEGTYFEQISFFGIKPLVVASEFIMNGDTNHIAHTIIDGSHILNPDTSSVVYFVSEEDSTSVLCGFTIRNGRGTCSATGVIEGGGILISGSGAKLMNNRITGNKCEAITPSTNTGCYGGGIGVNSSQTGYWVVLLENLIDSNSVVTDKPSAICCGGGLACNTNVRIFNNRINYNLAKRTVNSGSSYASGGGIYSVGSGEVQAIIIGNTVLGNQLSGNLSTGGGIYCRSLVLTFSKNSIIDNHVGTTTSITNLIGGGMQAPSLLPGSAISNNLFKGNISESAAGGLQVESSSTISILRVENNYFIENHANAWGGAFGSFDCRLMLVNNVFSHNEAYQGGVGYIDQSTLIPDEHTAWLINNTFSYNKGIFSNGSLDFMRSNPILMNCVFWQNEAPNIPGINATAGFSEIAYSDIDTTEIGGLHYVGPGILFTDPMFSDTINLIPEPFSPCVDAGIASYSCIHGDICFAPLYDITGAPRPVGNGYDMGAFDLKFSEVGIRSIVKTRLPFSVQPNPFSAFTTFTYALEESSHVLLQLFDGCGRLVNEPVNVFQTKGEHYLQWNSEKLPSGIYYCRLTAGKRVMSVKIIKMK